MARAETQVATDAYSSGARKVFLVDDEGYPVYGFCPSRAIKYRGNFSAAQTNLTVLAAPGAGLCIYVTDVLFTNGATAGSMSLSEVSGASSAFIIPTTYLDKSTSGGSTSSIPMHFQTPLKLNTNFALKFTSTTCTTHSLVVSGYIGTSPELTTTSTTTSTSTSTTTSTTSTTSSTSTSSSSTSSTLSTTSSTSSTISTTSSTSSTSSTLSTTSSSTSTTSSSTSSTTSTSSSTSSTLSTTSSTSSTISTTSSTSSTISTTSSTSSTSSTISTGSTVSTISTGSTMSTTSSTSSLSTTSSTVTPAP